VAPYAGHSATIADFARGQSLIETLHAAGLGRLLVTDWKSATVAMKQ
jgi:poly(3-hydroxybutyrate) depolymerase